MSETTIANEGRDQNTGRFVSGNIGGPGRPKSSRNQISENFLTMFARDVEEHGESVIQRVRAENPTAYLKIWSDLLPRDVHLDVSVDFVSTLANVRSAIEALGNDPGKALATWPKRRVKLIEAECLPPTKSAP